MRSLMLLLLAAPLLAAPLVPNHVPPHQRIADHVYLQEVGVQFPSPAPLRSIAAFRGSVFALTDSALLQLQGTNWIPQPDLTPTPQRLVTTHDSIWAMGLHGLHRWTGTNWQRLSDQPVSDVTTFRNRPVAASGDQLFWIDADRPTPLTTNAAPFNIERVFQHQATLWIQGGSRLTFLNHDRFGGLDVYAFPADQAWDWGRMPSPRIRDALAVGPALWVATDRGVASIRGMSLQPIAGPQGLPVEATTCLAPGFTNDLWIGTRHGAVRHVAGQFHYFAGRRWLPGDHVHDLAVDGQDVWVATDAGAGLIRYQPFTLAKKAAWYEQHLEAWGQKRLGFTHKLEWDDALNQYVREVSDNDGGYSGDYLAAQSYRWAVTRDPVARREALRTFHALRWLERMTGIPGFPARAVWVKGERGHKAGHGSGGFAAEWNDCADKRFEWKGDTSSDEITSHFYAVGLFLELVAEGKEREMATQHLAALADHLIRNNWSLVDHDGKPSRWGRWSPEYFATDEGRFDRGLQAAELLSFMRTAHHFTGEPRFEEAYQRLVKLGYPGFTLRQRSTFPPEDIAHFEDQLGFWAWWNLLRHETNPDLYATYRRSYERSYETVRIERNPWYQFVFGVLTGHDCEPAAAVDHLREWPLDLRVWSFENSHRADLRTPDGFRAPKGGVRPFSPREHQPMRWDAWTMQEDGGTGGRDVAEPGAWLVTYWMARFHGYISAPLSEEPALTQVHPDEIPRGGAQPYSGPDLPILP
jgi:hypothetical protein